MTKKLFAAFAGQWVNVILKSLKGRQEYPNGIVSEGNVVLEGHLLDEDEHFFYLGNDQDGIDEVLAKSDVIRIYQPKVRDELSEMFDDAEDDGSRQ